MRLWFFSFDGELTTNATDRTPICLEPLCESLLRNLSDNPSDQVVIISNRSIDDVVGRIKIPGVILGGCDGIEWQLPSGYRIGPFREHEDDLIHCRLSILPELSKIVSGASIEMDDKLWSIAVDTSRLKYNDWVGVENKIRTWSRKHGLTVSYGLDWIYILLIPRFNRSVGISYIAKRFNFNPIEDSIIYAGDDESDIVAMWWTILFGGTAIMVGNDLQVPGALFAKNCSHLTAMIEELLLLHGGT